MLPCRRPSQPPGSLRSSRVSWASVAGAVPCPARPASHFTCVACLACVSTGPVCAPRGARVAGKHASVRARQPKEVDSSIAASQTKFAQDFLLDPQSGSRCARAE